MGSSACRSDSGKSLWVGPYRPAWIDAGFVGGAVVGGIVVDDNVGVGGGDVVVVVGGVGTCVGRS